MAKKPTRAKSGGEETSAPNGPEELPERWSAQRKTELVLRLLRGEPLDAVSRESQIPAHELEGWKRVFLGNAMDVEIDGASRLLVSPELRAAAGLAKDTMLLGMGSHLELWDAERYAAHEAAVMAQGLPDALQDFSF